MYEYKVTKVHYSDDVADALNDKSNHEWEFHSMTYGHNFYVLIFKRVENKPPTVSTDTTVKITRKKNGKA